ncbi:MAG: hypothetical protein ACI8P3_002861, partial [Saprospiraceae bacterium]
DVPYSLALTRSFKSFFKFERIFNQGHQNKSL